MKTRLRSILERVVSYGLIAAAAFGLFYFQTTIDTRQKASIQGKVEELSKYKTQIGESNRDLAARQHQLDQVRKQIQERRLEITTKFESVLDKAANYTQFIEQVERKAKALDVIIANSAYNPPAPAAGAPSNYLEFKFTLDLTASYEKMKHFLWEMENTLGRMVKISQLKLHPPIVDNEGTMRLSLTLSTFFLP